MTDDTIYFLGKETIKMVAMLASPLLISSLVIGLMVSIFQAITQINEATLTFIPKIMVVGVVLLILGPWMLQEMVAYTTNLLESIANYVR